MDQMLQKLSLYLEFPFVRHALIVGVLVSLCTSLLGVTLVLKRFSFIGDGLSHVAFGAMSVAAVVGLTNEMTVVLPVTILCAVLLLCSGQRAKIKGDAAVAMISVSALAVGYMVMSIFPSASGNVAGDVCTTLFGSTSILTLTEEEVQLCVILSALVVAAFCFCYHKIFCITFDESFLQTTGTRVKIHNFLLAAIIATVIVLAMNLVGSLLISALVVFPALSAMRVCKNFRSVTICAAVISAVCSFVGILASILAGTPVGSTIVVADLIVFVVFTLLGKVTGGRKS